MRPRLDLEALRDSVLSVSGKLDLKLGTSDMLAETNYRRSLYLTVSRTRLDATRRCSIFRIRMQPPMSASDHRSAASAFF
jgi:hypothetical protein